MRTLLAASIAALTLLIAGSAHAQSAPTLPNHIKPSQVRGLVPNGVGGWDWIAQVDSSDGVLHVISQWHQNSDGSWDGRPIGKYHTPEKQQTSIFRNGSESIAKRPTSENMVATNASSVSFSSSSHH